MGSWPEEIEFLRSIIGENPQLEENIKWGIPVFTYNGKNVIGIAKFKSYFGLWFYEGALLQDEKGLLVNAQKGKTKALRQMRFNSIDEVPQKVIKDYIKESITNIDEGRIFTPSRSKEMDIPEELQQALNHDKQLKESFDALPFYKRKEYCEHINGAKRQTTKDKRLEKSIPMIKSGKGLNDKYKI